MDKEEYYTRIEKINKKFSTDRVSADEEYQLVCQRNYLSTGYIEHLEQQCKKQKEVIDRAIEYIQNHQLVFEDCPLNEIEKWFNTFYEKIMNILKEELDNG